MKGSGQARPIKTESGAPAEDQSDSASNSNASITRAVHRIDSRSSLSPIPSPDDQSQVLRVLDSYLLNHGVKRIIDTVARRRSELGFQSVGITSLNPGEGKTFYTAVVARGLVLYLSARVLVVDAKGYATTSSLLNTLATSRRVFDETYVAMGSTGSCTVASLSGGGNTPPTQNEFRCGELIRAVQNEYDVVLVDTQALSSEDVKGFDAGVIIQQLDTYMMVVPRQPVQPVELKAYSEKIHSLSTPCIGFVTNDKQVGS